MASLGDTAVLAEGSARLGYLAPFVAFGGEALV